MLAFAFAFFLVRRILGWLLRLNWVVHSVWHAPIRVTEILCIFNFEGQAAELSIREERMIIFVLILNMLRNLLWISNNTIVTWNGLYPTDYQLEVAHFVSINLAEIIYRDQIVFSYHLIGLVQLLWYYLTILNFIRSAQRWIDEAFSIRQSHSMVNSRITWSRLNLTSLFQS